jgi:hypothetical protein
MEVTGQSLGSATRHLTGLLYVCYCSTLFLLNMAVVWIPGFQFVNCSYC